MSGNPERIFIGWDRLPIAALEDALASMLPRDGMEPAAAAAPDVLVALPGSRAGRVLGLRLARRFGPGFVPPRLVTLGGLLDELVTLPGPVAPRLVRTLAWQRALRALGGDLRAITSHIPADDDKAAWSRLAATVRALHGELGAECASFASVQADPEIAVRPAELGRWRALEQAHTHFSGFLATEGLLDPHDARREALARGRLDRSRHVVLAGCLELSGLQRALIEALGDGVTALVPAPAEEAGAFDPFGGLDVEHWFERPLPIRREHWRVVGEPADQAQAVTDWIATLGPSRDPTQITIGLLDEEVEPALERRLARHGLRARSAAGRPVSASAPARLLAVIGAYLDRRMFDDFADLARFPEIEALLQRKCGLGGRSPAALLDAYHAAHLPARAAGAWCEDESDRREITQPVKRIHAALEELFAPLDTPPTRSVPAWVAPIRALLEALYARANLDALGRSGRRLRDELAAIGACLAELETVPAALSPALSVRDAVALLLAELSGIALPPDAGDEKTIEVLGWLELPLDDAPALAITGLAEGRVPASLENDAFLPDRLRARLGLVDDRRRLARDACLLHLLLRSRPEILLVSARRDAARNPLAPSRLLLRARGDEVAELVRHAFADPLRPAPAGRSLAPKHVLPRIDVPQPESISVTAFKAYLDSPYRYYLERLLRLGDEDDDAREVDAPGFGSLVHDVLAQLRDSAFVASTDARAIEYFLHAELERIARKRFGPDVQPAVTFQLMQVQRRLSLFSRVQAQRAAEGWRIEKAEWQPEEIVELDVEGSPIRLTGQIDRIDRHTSGRLAILDYKTGNSLYKWNSAYHPGQKEWRDLQLPLYRLLAAELDPGLVTGANVDFGWFCIGKDAANTAIVDHGVTKARWSAAVLAAADEKAKEIVSLIRVGAFEEKGNFDPNDPARAALAGTGLVGMEEDPDPLAAVLGDTLGNTGTPGSAGATGTESAGAGQ